MWQVFCDCLRTLLRSRASSHSTVLKNRGVNNSAALQRYVCVSDTCDDGDITHELGSEASYMNTRTDTTDDQRGCHQICRSHTTCSVKPVLDQRGATYEVTLLQFATAGSFCKYPMISGGVTMPPTIARACCKPMTAATITESTSSVGKNGGPLCAALRHHGHCGCKCTATFS